MHAIVAIVLLAGCGGRVASNSGTGDTAADAAAARTTPSSGNVPGELTALPDCKLGFFPSDASAHPCTYTYDGRCYDTKIKACACACPNRSGTQCISGFPDPRGRTLVICN